MLLRNFLSLSGAEVASKLVTFAAFAYLARVGGPEGLGYIEFAGAVLLCAGLVVDQGFGQYGAREIARTPERTAALVREIVLARALLALGAYAAVAGIALLLDRSPVLTRLLLVYGASLLALPLLLQWVFQGHDQMRTVAATQLIRQAVFAAVVFAVVRNAPQIWLVAAAEVCGVCSAAAYSLWMYRRRFAGVARTEPPQWGRLFREGVPIGVSQMLWVVRVFGGTLILGVVASPDDVGFFAGALRILVAAHAFVWLYYFNMLPSLARAWQQGAAGFSALIHRSQRSVAWAAVLAGVVWVGVAPAVVVAAYGPAFAPAGSTLQWMAGVCAAAAVSGHYRFGLIAAGRQTVEMATAALGALVAVICIPLGYARGGPAGAAVGLLAAELSVWVSAWWCGRRLLGV
jgi:O-antigen/teichoic acid export membrane protein